VLGELERVEFSSGRTIEYEHDSLRRRIAQKVDGTYTHRFIYGNNINPIAEVDGGGNTVSTFVYAHSHLLLSAQLRCWMRSMRSREPEGATPQTSQHPGRGLQKPSNGSLQISLMVGALAGLTIRGKRFSVTISHGVTLFNLGNR